MSNKTITQLIAEINTNIADNTSGDISASDIRNALLNMVDSIKAIFGWANYVDDTYTEGSPLAVVADTDTILPNDGVNGLTNEDNLPLDIDCMYAPAYIDYDNESGTFTKGLTVTGGTSGATAVIASVIDNGTTGRLLLKSVTGTFQNNEQITDTSTGVADVNGSMGNGIIHGSENDAYIITIDFKAKPSSGVANRMECWFDIGGAVGELYRRSVGLSKGGGVEQSCVFSTAVYTLDTWESNGANIYIRANGDVDVYDIRFIVYRLFQPVI